MGDVLANLRGNRVKPWEIAQLLKTIEHGKRGMPEPMIERHRLRPLQLFW
jgi:hypothetical protein